MSDTTRTRQTRAQRPTAHNGGQVRYLELGAFLLLCLDFLPEDLLLLVALISVCAPHATNQQR